MTFARKFLSSTFTPTTIGMNVIIGGACIAGDQLVAVGVIRENIWLRALTDNLVHGIVALLSWAAVLDFRFYKLQVMEVLLSGFLGSAVDLDHFVAAGSVKLKVSKRKNIKADGIKNYWLVGTIP